ncbi:hypothetical protein KIPB_003905, partial [Kipferlia bialata]
AYPEAEAEPAPPCLAIKGWTVPTSIIVTAVVVMSVIGVSCMLLLQEDQEIYSELLFEYTACMLKAELADSRWVDMMEDGFEVYMGSSDAEWCHEVLGELDEILAGARIQFSDDNPYYGGETYTGGWKNGSRDGMGTLEVPGVSTYVGVFRNDRKNGHGTETFEDGREYTGEYNEGRRHGYGSLLYTNGEEYVGEWVYGERHGQGTYYHADGSVYEGDWENGEKEGLGTYTTEGYVFSGRYVNDKRHGVGVITYSSGMTLECTWTAGLCYEPVHVTHPNGGTYVGGWGDGNMHGEGTYTRDDTVYVGSFRDGKYHGHGVMTVSGVRYEGQFQMGRRHGTFTVTDGDGSTRTEQWVEETRV